MDDERMPIRKVIDGVNLNTDTAHCFHTNMKVVSELVDDQVVHRRIHQGLYQVQGNARYFLAFWNKPQWNDEALQFQYVDDAMLIDVEQAKQWMLTYCPEKLDAFVKDLGKTDRAPSSAAVNLRMPMELRNHLMQTAELTGNSLNKICLNLLNAGMAYAHVKTTVSLPASFIRLEMPNGEPALDEVEHARQFEDEDDQALANYAETLYALYRQDFPRFLPVALHILYRLLHINRDAKRAICFAIWLSHFHRVSWQDSQDSRQRRPGPVEYGQWQWVKYEGHEQDSHAPYSSRWDKPEGQ
ncbi:hypothetical protein PPH41_01975 [Burkholderia gladioli]|nr:hypothetical protein [Burkholderia gladioli]